MHQPLFVISIRTTNDGGLEFQDNPQASLASQDVQTLQLKAADFFGAIQDHLKDRGFQKDALHLNMTFVIKYDLEIPEALAKEASIEPEIENPDSLPNESSL
jgi:hypothetical protein